MTYVVWARVIDDGTTDIMNMLFQFGIGSKLTVYPHVASQPRLIRQVEIRPPRFCFMTLIASITCLILDPDIHSILQLSLSLPSQWLKEIPTDLNTPHHQSHSGYKVVSQSTNQEAVQ